MKTFNDYYKEIKQNIIDHWTQEGHSVKNMENDPVANLLLSALSYQAYHIHNKIDRLENKVIREFRDRTLPYHLIKPVPAFSIVETKLIEGVNEKIMNEIYTFEFQNNKKQKVTFVPLLNTKLINAELKMGFQLEDNVWRIQLQTTEPLSDLSGLSFYLDTDQHIEIESITCGGERLPLINPSQFNELPFTKWFNNKHLFLNQNYNLFGSYDYWQEIFLNHAVKLYYVGNFQTKISQDNPKEIELDVTFSCDVSSNNFMKINCIPVVNVEKEGVVVDERNPVK
ncbi:MAG: type VI secretion system baseplate subunit TssF, partial [Bacteroidales bacterium]|nr:type VI secretion system baseplate subunit TssF [Bacteroidales bacterium]